MASGALPPWISAARAEETGTPGRAPPRSPTSYTVVAPYSPRGPAKEAVSVPQATASTVPATARASVRSSSVIGVGPASPASANTHTLSIAISDHLQLLEEGDDALGAVPLVHHDLARTA